jgi:hypothetical protein
MDRSLLLDQLARTERHISSDAQLLQQQQALIEELERRGESTDHARSLLQRLKEMQAMRIADRDRMRAALERADTIVQ